MEIPIRNVFYLLCYAWDRLDEGRVVESGAVDSPDLPNLLARVLVSGTRHVFRRGLDRGYETFAEDTRRPRGRVVPGESARRLLKRRRQIHCHFDDFTANTLPNQILRSTLFQLLAHADLEPGLKHDVAGLTRRLAEAQRIPLAAGTFRRVQLHSNNSYYDFLLKVCELCWWSWLPTQKGEGRFRDFIRDESRMAKLFEHFVRNFYRREQSSFWAGSEKIRWDVPEGCIASDVLPQMVTDVTLRADDRVIVIDTKYYKEAMRERYGAWRLQEGNLYQIWTYLTQGRLDTEADRQAEGILLYPAVRQDFDHSWETRGHRMRACSLDLSRPWPEIHGRLLELIA